MAISKPAVAGTAAIGGTAIAGGIGYSVSQGPSEDSKELQGTNQQQENSKKQKRTLKKIKETPKGNSYASKIKNAGFELLTEDDSETDWGMSKILNLGTHENPGKEPTQEELQNKCINLLEKVYSSKTIPEDYKEAVKKCSKGEGLKKKLENLGLSLLTDGDHEVLKNRWNEMSSDNSLKGELKTDYSYDFSSDGKNSYSEANAKELISKCEKYSNNNTSYNWGIDIRWKRYLTLCSKDNGTKTYESFKNLSFWTNEVSVDSEEQ